METIDTSMQYLSTKGWENVSDFKDGCAIVNNDDGKYTVIDKKFNEIFTSNYEVVEVLSSDYFVYKKYDKYGILDKTGKVVIKASFSSCTQTEWSLRVASHACIKKNGRILNLAFSRRREN